MAMVRAVAMGALVALFCALIAFITGPTARAAAVVCPPSEIYVNTGGQSPMLDKYATDGSLLSSVSVARAYGDIGFSGDGLKLYAVNFGSPVLYTIDVATGAETASVQITGAAGGASLNAVSALPNGKLLLGSFGSSTVSVVDPTTGTATAFGASFPSGFVSAGDFLTLPDGDILAVAAGGNRSVSTLFRFHPDNTVTEVGTVEGSWGAAQSGGQIYLATPSGKILTLDAIPTASSSALVPTTTVVQWGPAYWGATSQQDSGLCPQLTVTKTADPASGSLVRPGQTVTYSIVLSNVTGTAPAQVDLTDDLTGVLDDAAIASAPAVTSGTALTIGPITSDTFSITGILPVGATSTISYSVKVDDPVRGDHALGNYVVDTGTAPPTTCEPGNTACTMHPIPGLALVKSASPNDTASYVVGQTVTYSFLATNTGTVTLTDVSVSESSFTGSGAMGPISPSSVASLAPGQSATFTASYTLTQADVDRGSTVNTATATGTPPTGDPVTTPPSTVTLTGVSSPALSVVKSADVQSITAAGETVTYSFVATNTGNVTLTDVSVSETAFTGSGAMGPISPASVATLAPGESVTFTASYVATQADVDAGKLTNTATATGTPPTGDPVTSPPSTVNIPAAQNPALVVVKSADVQAITAAGQTVTYSFVATNTGNVTLTDVSVSETAFTGSGTMGPISPASVATLAPGESATFTASYVTTQADVDAGKLTNTATATGTPPSGDPVTSPPSTVNIPAAQNPALTVVKSADVQAITAAGQTVNYSFVATNTGNVTLTDVSVSESSFSGSGTMGPISPASVATLAPGESATFTASYVTTQADVDAGKLTNTATATGTPPTGDPVTSPPSTVNIPAAQNPALVVVKSADVQSITAAGQTVTYSFVATNTGNVTLTDVSVSESSFSGSGTMGPISPTSVATLAPGESATFTASYVTTQADVDAGKLTNTATATGTPPSGDPVTSPPSTVTLTVPPVATLPVTGGTLPIGALYIGFALLVLGFAVVRVAMVRRRRH